MTETNKGANAPDEVDFDLYHCPELSALADAIADWRKRKGFATSRENVNDKLLLLHSEISEAVEALRKDDEQNFAEELADVLMRLLDITSSLDIDISREVYAKMIANEARPIKHGKSIIMMLNASPSISLPISLVLDFPRY